MAGRHAHLRGLATAIHEVSRLDARRRGAMTEAYGAIRRKHAPAQAGGGASEGNGADDALMVDQGLINAFDISSLVF